jgi:hypothetical protein
MELAQPKNTSVSEKKHLTGAVKLMLSFSAQSRNGKAGLPSTINAIGANRGKHLIQQLANFLWQRGYIVFSPFDCSLFSRPALIRLLVCSVFEEIACQMSRSC